MDSKWDWDELAARWEAMCDDPAYDPHYGMLTDEMPF